MRTLRLTGYHQIEQPPLFGTWCKCNRFTFVGRCSAAIFSIKSVKCYFGTNSLQDYNYCSPKITISSVYSVYSQHAWTVIAAASLHACDTISNQDINGAIH